MSIRDWALDDQYLARRPDPPPEAQAAYADGRPISDPPPPPVPPRPAPDAQAWSPELPPRPTFHPDVRSAVQGPNPQTSPRWRPVPETCVLVRPGPSEWDSIMASVPDLLPAYERHHGVAYDPVDGMDFAGALGNGGPGRYGGRGRSLQGYLQEKYGGIASAGCSASFSVQGK